MTTKGPTRQGNTVKWSQDWKIRPWWLGLATLWGMGLERDLQISPSYRSSAQPHLRLLKGINPGLYWRKAPFYYPWGLSHHLPRAGVSRGTESGWRRGPTGLARTKPQGGWAPATPLAVLPLLLFCLVVTTFPIVCECKHPAFCPLSEQRDSVRGLGDLGGLTVK